MLLRDCPGFAWYFCNYELYKRWLRKHNSAQQEQTLLDKVGVFFAGGFAGCTTWLLCYPADFLKTRLQTSEGCNKGLFRLAADIYREKGLMRMYKGIHVQLIRAFPANASGMFVFENVKVFLSNL